MKKLVVLLLASMVVGSAMAAPVDPDPNMLGLYGDVEATVTSGPAAGHYVYVILTNPTVPYVNGVEFSVTPTGTVYFLPPILWEAANTLPIDSSVPGGAMSVACAWNSTPLPTSEATVLCALNILPIGPNDLTLGACLVPSGGITTPAILDEAGEVMQVGTSTNGGVSYAMGTGTEVVAVENVSLDQVKSLYR